MGGIGSGYRCGASSKRTTNDFLSLDVRKWHRAGLLTAGNAFYPRWYHCGEMVGCIGVFVESNRVFLSYHVNYMVLHRKMVTQLVYTSWSSCNYGGKRPWLICPMTGCGRRVAILYRQYVFSCRHCNNLAYPSQNETLTDRLTRRADGIRGVLGWDFGIFNGKEIKRKGMHSKKFKRLVVRHDWYVYQALSRMRRYLGESYWAILDT